MKIKTALTCFIILTLTSCGPEDLGLNITRETPQRQIASEIPQTIETADDETTIDALIVEQIDEIKIGLILPLSGEAADTGNALLDAVTLAMADLKDPRLHLFPADSMGTPEGAAAAARKLIEQDVSIVIGPLFSQSVEGAAPLLREANINLLSFSNNQIIAGNGTYITGFTPDQEIQRIVRYAKAQGYDKFAALIPEGPYGDEVLESLSNTVLETQSSITGLESYVQDADLINEPARRLADYDRRRKAYLDEVNYLEGLDDDLADEILKDYKNRETLGGVSFEALLLPEGGALLKSLAPVLPFYEIHPENIKFLGTGLWDDLSLTREPPLMNGWFASIPREGLIRFNTRFEELFGYVPPRIAALGYDIAALVGVMARDPRPSYRFNREQIENPNGYQGFTGVFRFTQNGLTERQLAVMMITEDGIETIDPALTTFEPLRQYVSQNRIQQGQPGGR